MAGKRKPHPIEIFDLTIADADHLVALVGGFTNQRVRRMRAELRDSVGEAIGVRVKDRHQLDCLESDDVFLVFKPAGRLCRDDLADARPLLRQALVAACTAFETYLSDKAMSRVGPLLRTESTLTRRLRELPLTLTVWMKIDARYERKGSGLRALVVEPAVRQMASTSPSKVGALLSLIDIDNWSRRIDGERHIARGETERQLQRITDRRNRIAHEADRVGRGRANLTVAEVRDDIGILKAVVGAIETL